MQAQQQHEVLQDRNAKDLVDLQQKSYLKVLGLDRRIKTMEASLEKEQLELWVACAFGLGHQTAANNIEVPSLYLYFISACLH